MTILSTAGAGPRGSLWAGPLARLGLLIDAWRDARAARRAAELDIQALRDLDDYLLRDIGVAREEIESRVRGY